MEKVVEGIDVRYKESSGNGYDNGMWSKIRYGMNRELATKRETGEGRSEELKREGEGDESRTGIRGNEHKMRRERRGRGREGKELLTRM